MVEMQSEKLWTAFITSKYFGIALPVPLVLYLLPQWISSN